MAMTKETQIMLAYDRHEKLKRECEISYQRKFDELRHLGEIEKLSELNYEQTEQLDKLEHDFIKEIFRIFEES